MLKIAMMTATVTAALTYQASRKSVVAQSSTRLGGYIAKAVSELVAQEWKTKRCQYFLKVLARLTAVSTNHSHVRCSRSIWQQLFSYRWMRHGVVVVCCGCVLCANWVSCWTGLMLQQLTQLAQGTQSSNSSLSYCFATGLSLAEDKLYPCCALLLLLSK